MYEIFERLLREKGVTSYKVSKDTGVTQTALSNWKSGRSTPSMRTLQKIADYFGVTVDYLMTGKNPEVQSLRDVPLGKVLGQEEHSIKRKILDDIHVTYGPSVRQAMELFLQLDVMDQGKAIGRMETMLEEEKYSIQGRSSGEKAM